MTEPKPKGQVPSIGRIVIYRTKAGADIPAIITGLVEYGMESQSVHLQQFPPPVVAADALSAQWGAGHSEEPKPGHWRWPEVT